MLDVPELPLATSAIKNKHEGIIHGVRDVGWAGRSGCGWMGVKRTHDLLTEHFGGGNDATNGEARQPETARTPRHVESLHQGKMIASMDKEATKLGAWNLAMLSARFTENPVKLNPVKEVHCANSHLTK